MKELIKDNWKKGLLMAIIPFIFSALGVFATQTFLVGKYAQTIENNKGQLDSMKSEFQIHKDFDEKMYLKKEVFDEFKNGEHKLFREQVDRIELKLDRLLQKENK